jgi:hypothetical protein
MTGLMWRSVMIVYSDEPSSRSKVPYHLQKATRNYLTHFENYLLLDFMARQSDRKGERDQARKEMVICERKMRYWRSHPNFDQGEAASQSAKMKSMWAARR